VAVLDQNRWPLSTRISGHFEPESLAGFDQNMQFSLKKGIDHYNWKDILSI